MRTGDTATTDILSISRLCEVLGIARRAAGTGDASPTVDTALQVAELLCQSVIDDGFAAIMLVAPAGHILFANPALGALLGHADGAMDGVALTDLLHPDDRASARALLSAAAATPTQPETAELRIRQADATWLWIDLMARGSPSPARRLLCGVQYISRRPALAPTHTDTDALAIVDAALDAIVSMDRDGRISAFNPAAERVFGWTRGEAIGRMVSELMIPPAQRQPHQAGLLRHLATGQSGMLDRRVELTALHAQGHEFPIELTVTSTGSGDARGYTAFIRDISDHRRLLADLGAAAGRLAAVVQAQQRLAASDAGADALIEQGVEIARELMDGRRAAFEPLGGDPDITPDAAGGSAPSPPDGSRAQSRAGRDEPARGHAPPSRLHFFCAREALFDWPTDAAIARDFAEHSMVVSPLRAGDRLLGFIKVLARAPQRYTAADAHALELFAASLGAVLQRQRSDGQRRQTEDTQARILAMQRQFSASVLELAPLMALMADRAQSLCAADAAALQWIDGDAFVYVSGAGWGLQHVGLRVPRDGSLTGLCATLGEALVCVDTETDDRVNRALARQMPLRSMVVVPLRIDDAVVGVLKVMSARVAAFSWADARHLELLAESMGSMIHRRRVAEQIEASEAEYRMLFDSNPHPMWVTDTQTLRFLAVNAATLEKYGYTQDQFLAMAVPGFRVADGIDIATLPMRMQTLRSRHRCSDGTLIDADLSFEEIRFAGRPARLVMALDVTQRLHAEAGQASAHRGLRLLSACNAALVRIDDEQRLLDELCRIAVELGGYRLAGIGYAIEGDDVPRLQPMAFASVDPAHVEAVFEAWQEITSDSDCPAAQAVRSNRAMTFADLGSGPDQAWCRLALAGGYHSAISLPLRNDGTAFGFFSLYSVEAVHVHDDELALLQELADNIAFGIHAIRGARERQQLMSELAHSGLHDAVTGLERYALLETRLAHLVTQPGQLTSVALLDLDRFNSLNETLGHDAADDILRRTGQRLLAFADDRVSVAHFASDEFVIVVAATPAEDAALMIERMRASLAEPIDGPEFSVVLTATAGISHSPAHGTDARELVRRAQAAMERGKGTGRDCSHAFLTGQMQGVDDRALLGARLRRALTDGEMCLHYQPQYAAASGRLRGFEALVRWTSPELGDVSPTRFIPIAETLGLMPMIGGWVVREACRQARAWLDAGHADFRVAINVSGQQLQRAGLVRVITDALAEFDVPAAMLDLELTESSLMENVAVVQGTLADLKALGLSLSLDDFGTGYSSLAYLKHLSLDKLKIDQSFVRGLPDDVEDAAIARTIVSMGHQLRLLVSAEGVETREQADFLRGIGCDELQGYYFGRPVREDEAARFFPPA